MESSLTDHLEQASKLWPLKTQRQAFRQRLQQRGQELTAWSEAGAPPCGGRRCLPNVLLVERDPIDFLAGFMAARKFQCPIFLGNLDWGALEWQQVGAQVQPDLIWGHPSQIDGLTRRERASLAPPCSPGWIMIPTGGTSGKIQFAIHTWETLMASVQGFQAYFDLKRVNCFCVLPLYHVSGLIQFLRSLHSGGQLITAPWRAVATGQWCEVDPARYFLSLVPTQLQELLENQRTRTWLSRFQTVLLGGGPAWPDLLEQARAAQIPLAPTYGMTETAAQVATLKPAAFLRGQEGCGPALPHAEIILQDPVGPDGMGTLLIRSRSLALGYYPDCFLSRDGLATDDLGVWDHQGSLQIVGRQSQTIITGGEKVLPTEVEAVIRATNQVQDICVIGLPDRRWGEAVTAVYVPKENLAIAVLLKPLLTQQLSNFKQPKYWIPVSSLPRNSQGKINREQVRQLAREWLCQPHASDVATGASSGGDSGGIWFED